MQLIIGLSLLMGFIITLGLFVYDLIEGKRRRVLERLKDLTSEELEEKNVEPLSTPSMNVLLCLSL